MLIKISQFNTTVSIDNELLELYSMIKYNKHYNENKKVVNGDIRGSYIIWESQNINITATKFIERQITRNLIDPKILMKCDI